MKVKGFISKLRELDEDLEIFYCGEDEEGDETNYQLIVIENQEKNGKGEIRKYYTVEKN